MPTLVRALIRDAAVLRNHFRPVCSSLACLYLRNRLRRRLFNSLLPLRNEIECS